ncbi:MAG: hypothetical protein IT540_09215, partial [Hyphomicrobium sp.]|nr:hypothetical protein [Hyphomicrobium sp.]
AATGARAHDEATIRTLLMSCRVIGREIERAFLGEMIGALRRRGVRRIRSEYIPTPRNAMVRDFYASCSFEQTGEDEDGKTTWLLSVDAQDAPSSRHVTATWEI